MRAPRDRSEDVRERLLARIAELEQRIVLLEAKVRSSPGGKPKASRPARRASRAPRCPGCLLELPRGHKRDACVWCGFWLAAARRRRAP
jgi:hypothetical protein